MTNPESATRGLRIDVGLVVRDADRCIAFYRDVLGLEYSGRQSVSGGHRDTFRWGNAVLKLLSLTPEPDLANPPGGSRGARGLRYFTLTTPELEKVVARCVAAGADVPTPVRTTPVGNSIAMVVDPEGNWIELLGI